MSQFYALMPDNTVKHIPLKEEIITENPLVELK